MLEATWEALKHGPHGFLASEKAGLQIWRNAYSRFTRSELAFHVFFWTEVC